jgi:hypothetical protein
MFRYGADALLEPQAAIQVTEAIWSRNMGRRYAPVGAATITSVLFGKPDK